VIFVENSGSLSGLKISYLGCQGRHRKWNESVESQWLTAREAAQYLKIKPRTLLQWAREKRIPAHRLSGIRRCVYRFLKSELDSMLGLSSAGSADGRRQ